MKDALSGEISAAELEQEKKIKLAPINKQLDNLKLEKLKLKQLLKGIEQQISNPESPEALKKLLEKRRKTNQKINALNQQKDQINYQYAEATSVANGTVNISFKTKKDAEGNVVLDERD